MITRTRQQGFTLLEILVALAIFSVMAVASFVGMRALLKTHQQLSQKEDQLQELMQAVTIIRGDMTQMVLRPVGDTSGGRMPAIVLRGVEDIEFTRAGYVNPLSMETRSQLQRVRYQVHDQQLYRWTWPALDRAPNTRAVKRVLLQGVQHFKLNYVDEKGKLVQTWSNEAAQNEGLPHGIVMTLELKSLGKLRLVLPVWSHSNEE